MKGTINVTSSDPSFQNSNGRSPTVYPSNHYLIKKVEIIVFRFTYGQIVYAASVFTHGQIEHAASMFDNGQIVHAASVFAHG